MPVNPRTGVDIEQARAEVAAGTRDPLDLQQLETIENDAAGWETLLQNYAASKGVSYDPSDLQGVTRNYSYAANAGRDPMEFINNQYGIYDQRASNVPGQTSYIDQASPQGQALMNQPGGPTGTGMDSNIWAVAGPTGQWGFDPASARAARASQAASDSQAVSNSQGTSGVGQQESGRPRGDGMGSGGGDSYSSDIQKIIDRLYSQYQK